MKSKVSYRVWQFWQGFKRFPQEGDPEVINTVLFPEEQNLFQQFIPNRIHTPAAQLPELKSVHETPDRWRIR